MVLGRRSSRTSLLELAQKTSLDKETFIKFLTKALKKDIEAIVEDDVADYFAANLIIPVERFILWQFKEEAKIGPSSLTKTINFIIETKKTSLFGQRPQRTIESSVCFNRMR